MELHYAVKKFTQKENILAYIGDGGNSGWVAKKGTRV